MTTSEINNHAQRCIRNYFKEDKIVMIDESIMKITKIMFFIYDLIFFGNQILISKETLQKVKRGRSRVTYKTYSDNCTYLIRNMQNDEYNNYSVVELKEYGNSYAEKVKEYLLKNSDVVYLLADKRLYSILCNYENLADRVKLIRPEMQIPCIVQEKQVRFLTLGFIKNEKGKKYFRDLTKNSALIKAYDENGNERERNEEIKVGDIVLTRSNKNTKYSFCLYKIVSNHSRNYSIKIIWTDLLKGHKTNFYIEKLEDCYRKIIYENVV